MDPAALRTVGEPGLALSTGRDEDPVGPPSEASILVVDKLRRPTGVDRLRWGPTRLWEHETGTASPSLRSAWSAMSVVPCSIEHMPPSGSTPPIALVVTDLDNTLWDWFDAWFRSFSTLLSEVSRLSGVAVEVLEQEARVVHQRRGTSEYSYLLNELPSLLSLSRDPLTDFDEAVHAQNAARKASTRLYDGVATTLRAIRDAGVPVVGYTESLAFWTEWRMRHLGVDGLLSVLYSSPDHDLPEGVSFANLRTQNPDQYGLQLTPHKNVPAGVVKPSTAVLTQIIQNMGASPETTLYVGDSLIKDVAMAQSVGTYDAHAAYGTVQHRPEYDLLRRVTHWTDQTVQRERLAIQRAGVVTPSYVLDQGFDQILHMFSFDGSYL